MVQVKEVTAYYSPTKGRNYFTKKSAIKNEAIAIILKKYPVEKFEADTGHSYDIRFNEPERFERIMRSLVWKIKNQMVNPA